MKTDYLNMLASLVLPAQILDYFLISGVEQTSEEIHIHLDEKMHPELSHDVHFESKGFMESVNVTDFPNFFSYSEFISFFIYSYLVYRLMWCSAIQFLNVQIHFFNSIS